MTTKTETKCYVDPILKGIDFKKPDVKGKVKTKELLHPRAAQVRTDTTSGEEVDMKRAEDYGEKMKVQAEGGKPITFPPVKYFLVEDMPGNKGKPVAVLFDGFHTQAGAEYAKVPEIDAIGWKGSWAQVLAAAAMIANVEHENNGKPLSYKDKVQRAFVYKRSLEAAGIPKKEWPSNREAAAMFGVSHTAIGDEDVFERRRADSKTGEEKKEEKKAQRRNGAGVVAAGAAHLNGVPEAKAGEKVYEVFDRKSGDGKARFSAESPAKALEKFKNANPKAELVQFATREIVAPANGSPKSIGFDWAGLEASLGSLARGWEGAGDLFDLKGMAEWKTGKGNLNAFATIFNAVRSEALKKKDKKKEDAKKPEAAKNAEPEAAKK